MVSIWKRVGSGVLWSTIQGRQWWHTPLIPAATLVSHTVQAAVVQAFNPSTRDEYKAG